MRVVTPPRPARPARLARAVLGLGAALALAGSGALAQTADENHPGPLAPGVNKGVVDSIAGATNWWTVRVNPGRFEVRFHWDVEQEFVHTREIVNFGCALRPRDAGVVSFEPHGHDTVCRGTASRRAALLLAVVPKPSRLVRQTNAYTIEVTGSADYGPGAEAGRSAAADDVTGVYKVMLSVPADGRRYTMVKFQPDGRITSPEGYTGRWSLFDAASRVYSIQFDGQQITDVYQPGRGFADHAGNVDFQSVGH